MSGCIQFKSMDNCIVQEKRQLLKNKFYASKKAIESMLKQFKYQDQSTHADNMKKLCSCLENVLNVETLYDFHKFLTNQDHFPIQVNFKCLKYENLMQMYEDWLISKQDHSGQHLQRTMTHKHRNILFKKILIDQNDTIREYFETISKKKKLRGFDLFQLLTELLGPYFLYEYYSDTQSFFQKVNSFQNFTKVVESFIKNGIRVYSKDHSDPNDQSYIRLHELEALIEFWELTNPELTIQENARKNLKDAGVQTAIVNSIECETQTSKQIEKNYLNIINRTIRDINGVIEFQNDSEVLRSLDKVLDTLRSEKIFVTSYNPRRRTISSGISSEFSQTESMLLLNKPNPKQKILSPTKKPQSPKKSPTTKPILGNQSPLPLLTSSQDKQDPVKTIFRYLCSLDKLHCLTLDILHHFFCELGLIGNRDHSFVDNLVAYGYMEEKDDVTFKEFKAILRQVMREDRRLTLPELCRYVAEVVEGGAEIRKTAYFRMTDDKKKDNSIVSDRQRSRNQSRTTYPMDSDGGI